MKSLIDEQVSRSQEAQANYEREIMLHAEDLKALNESKEVVKKLQTKLNDTIVNISKLNDNGHSLMFPYR